MTAIDIAEVGKIITDVAVAEVMPRFCRLQSGDIETKRDKTVVTIADRETEKVLSARLQNYLPGSVIVGEESCEHTPEILSRFSDDHDIWVIDPIDGTRQFVDGKPGFAVMVALMRQRQTIAAWIHDPVSGDMLFGERGSGVWLGNKKMQLAGKDPAIPGRGIIGARLKSNLNKPEFTPIKKLLPDLDSGKASGFDYARLFTGGSTFADSSDPRASFLLYRRSKAWDHLPGLFLHKEAGGYSANFFGKPYDMQKEDHGLLVAVDEEEWKSLLAIFKPVLDSLTLD